MATVTRGSWAKRLCNAYDLEASQRRLNALVAWETAEGTSAKFNPLATTLRMKGSTKFNSVGVQDYPDLQTGLKATKQTLAEDGHGYENIRYALIGNLPAKTILECVAESAWGTGALALLVLPYVKENYDRYADKPIGQ